jgi:putative phosphoribosyl transferase
MAPSEQGGAGRDEREVEILAGGVRLGGTLTVPPGAEGVVVFVHGSGSSRFSARNRFVGQAIRDVGLGTLLFDLLSAEEERKDRLTAQLRFDIALLTGRVLEVTSWLRQQDLTRTLKVGYFGASTGAAAALAAAAQLGDIAAVVSRGGRPDLAGPWLAGVTSPTLLIVGGDDVEVIRMNRDALARLGSVKEMRIVPGATHLFEEPGTLEEVARLAAAWFRTYLVG